jgi:DNA polymerase III delta subunit
MRHAGLADLYAGRVAAQELKPAYLVAGNDLPKVERALERLRARFDPASIERLVAGGKDGASGHDVVAACNAGTLLSGDRLVLVAEVDGRPNEWGKLAGGWKQEDVDAVVGYLAGPAPGTVLCLVARQLKASSPLGKAVAKTGDVLSWEVDERRLPRWVGESFAARGVKIDGDACQVLVDLVGEDKLVLSREVDKLATWAAGEPLGVEEVRTLVAPLGEGHSWDLTDALGGRDVAKALDVVESEYRRSAHPGQEPAMFSSRVGAYVLRLARAKSLIERGARAPDVAKALGIKEFPAKKLTAQAERFSSEELRDATVRVAGLDRALKGGSKLAPELEVQLAIADVAREGR